MLLPLFAIISVLCSVTVTVHCATFSNAAKVGTITSIREESGLCASRTHSNVLYTHNDSGDTHRIYAISATSGKQLAEIDVDGAKNKDWEDIACGPCPGGSDHCIYIADTGGNTGTSANTIYRIREPRSIKNQHVSVESSLMFSWDQHDCETVMVDPKGEIYIVSKVSGGQRQNLLSYRQVLGEIIIGLNGMMECTFPLLQIIVIR